MGGVSSESSKCVETREGNVGLRLSFAHGRRRKITPLGVAAGLPGVKIRGVEVTQTVQDMENSVVLIADKPTAVRVYVDPTAVAKAGNITGEIKWRRPGAAGGAFLPAINTIRIDPGSPKSLPEQRRNLLGSLNFLLPAEAIGAGQLEIAINRVLVSGGADLVLEPQPARTVTFKPGVPLRARVIGLRYQSGNPPVAFTPSAVHFAHLKSFLSRAYPVPSVEWSQLVVDANFAPLFDQNNAETAILANAQIAAIRSREVGSGIDPRTHYYGLVDDNNGTAGFFMRGRAFMIPETPRPDVVASGPCGVPHGLAGDNGPSYASWYGAHELGHTFGRYHPGFPSGTQDASDSQFPYPEGLLSTHDERYMGFDVGDQTLNLPMEVLPGNEHHDVMTYADNQWVSAYTYKAIYDRLAIEDQQFR